MNMESISSFGNCGCLFCFLMMPTHKVTVDAYLDKVNSFGEIEKKQSKALNISCKLNNVACNKLKLEDYREAEKLFPFHQRTMVDQPPKLEQHCQPVTPEYHSVVTFDIHSQTNLATAEKWNPELSRLKPIELQLQRNGTKDIILTITSAAAANVSLGGRKGFLGSAVRLF
ncbi:hypothetical protein EJB05_14638 [Eragrostis curvula]|uniref:Uncharacterized protein n=1 Tax=Eragrostis curvula TaxID=38414 RepID=A0A5J9VXI5_9POAL|nr:hypothetical protein EJB05_14638 [Eragrostis curvula]